MVSVESSMAWMLPAPVSALVAALALMVSNLNAVVTVGDSAHSEPKYPPPFTAVLEAIVSLMSVMALHSVARIPPPSPRISLMPTVPSTVLPLMVEAVMLVEPACAVPKASPPPASVAVLPAIVVCVKVLVAPPLSTNTPPPS